MSRMSCACVILLLSAAAARADASDAHQDAGVACRTCHACDVPTGKDPCLKNCPRSELVTVHHSPEEGPDVLVMSEMSDKYGPVVFTHRIHAKMSEMSGGCAVCHHYNRWSPVMGCSSCHEAGRKREDLSKPDLKSAFHRQCMGCHRKWSHSEDCGSCHVLKAGAEDADKEKSLEEARKKIHPDVPVPGKLVFATGYDGGKAVAFDHSEHTGLLGIKCDECHKQETCIKCHDKEAGPSVTGEIRPGRPPKICSSCHQ